MAKIDVSVATDLAPQPAWKLASDLGRFGEWLTIFGGWRSEVPTTIEEGTCVSSCIKVKGFRNVIHWRVTRYDEPKLIEMNGQPCPESYYKGQQFAFIKGVPKLLGSPHTFGKHGQSGAELSNLLPHTAEIVDDIAIIMREDWAAFESVQRGINSEVFAHGVVLPREEQLLCHFQRMYADALSVG